ncbi:hypothetical protein BOX15_Mlig022711g1 [Macrostomum lignano]|uniref:Uncharacterized protein n=1 Tax=Macrostomum lignano TaxID=282301 RepID=A0A267F6D8_9PLAT|nr:hypothetical protein BOX15_Mlig022711g1 [Macrostomum lignano]
MSICVRYLDISDGSVAIHEEFICFVHVEDLTGIGLATKLLETLDSLHITAQLVAQGYDGASAMSGKFNGVQAVIREQLGRKLAIYVYCAAHNLNLSLQDACKLDSVRAAITAVNTVTVFICSSPQRTALLEKKSKSWFRSHLCINFYSTARPDGLRSRRLSSDSTCSSQQSLKL